MRTLSIVDVILLQGVPALEPATAAEVFCDSVAQEMFVDGFAADQPTRAGWAWLVEITSRPGVTDPVALTALDALRVCLPGGLPADARVQTAVQYLVGVAPGASVDPQSLGGFFHNPLIQAATCIGAAGMAGRPPSPGELPPRRVGESARGRRHRPLRTSPTRNCRCSRGNACSRSRWTR